MPGGDDDTTPTPTPTPTVTMSEPTPEPTPTPTTTEPTPVTPTPTPASPTPTPASPSPNTTAPPPASVSIVNIAQGYNPATLTIPVGTNVTWKNNDPLVPHTAIGWTTARRSTRASSRPRERVARLHDRGTFAYTCAFHGNMKATVVVA